MNRGKWILPACLPAVLAVCVTAFSHCQIPCGIYDDRGRFSLMEEHVSTIEKSMEEINGLSGEEKPNWNKIVRWVQNKDLHADELSEIATQYFMAQRVKPVDSGNKQLRDKYILEISLLHEIVVYAMKAKQTTDLKNVEKLRSLVRDFKASYLGESPAAPEQTAAEQEK